VIFTRLAIRNFLSVHSMDFDERSFRPGVHLVHGVNFDMSQDGSESNGSGKSSILEAVLYSIWGELSRGTAKEDSVINHSEGKNCSVTIEFTHGANAYKIKRYRKDDEEHGSGMRWWVNGEEKSSAGVKESQKSLEGELPVSLRVFKLAVMVGQGMPDKFLDLSESEKQDLLSQIVDLGVYDRASARISNRLSSLSTESAVRRATIEQVRKQVESTRTDMLNYQDAVRAYEERSAVETAAVAVEAGRIEEGIRVATESIETLTGVVAETEGVLVAAKGVLEVHVEVCTRESQPAYELQGRIKSLKESQDKLAKTSTVCPTCKRPLETGNLVEHMVEMAVEQEALEAQLRGMVGGLKSLAAKRETMKSDVDKHEKELRSLRARSTEAGDTRRNLETRQRENSSRMATHQKTLAAMVAKVDAAQDTMVKLQESLPSHEAAMTIITGTQKNWEFWKSAVPNLRAAAMEEVLTFLNNRLAHYMEVFSGGALGVSLYQEAYGKGSRIKVSINTRAEVYALCSGGEKRRVDLALYLSLSDLLQTTSGMACNLLAADEICDSLSPVGVRQFLDVLRGIAQGGRCVLVMSHNAHVASEFEFDSRIVVECRDGKSTLRSE
jgi:DNA repair exonuclease SbcCD ATPase subunit